MITEITSLAQVRRDVDRWLSHYLDQQIDAAAQIDPAYVELWQVVRQVVMAGGKRFRPYLACLSYQAHAGQDYGKIMPVAGGLELLHASLLIHDDIIDRDYTRHGQVNIAGYFRKHYRQAGQSDSIAQHYANSTALLAGDVLLVAAQNQLSQADFPAARKKRALDQFSQIMFQVAGGELIDTLAVLHPPTSVDSLAIAKHKTASYSVVAPLYIGAILAGAKPKTLTKLKKMGEALGIAYQMTNDLQGLFGGSDESSFSDLREGKRTHLIQQALLRTNGEQQQFILDWLGQATIGQTELERIRTIVTDCGAQTATQNLIADYLDLARNYLKQLDWPKPHHQALTQFIEKTFS